VATVYDGIAIRAWLLMKTDFATIMKEVLVTNTGGCAGATVTPINNDVIAIQSPTVPAETVDTFFTIETPELCPPTYSLVELDSDTELAPETNGGLVLTDTTLSLTTATFDALTSALVVRIKVTTDWNLPVYKVVQVTQAGAENCHLETLSLASRFPYVI